MSESEDDDAKSAEAAGTSGRRGSIAQRAAHGILDNVLLRSVHHARRSSGVVQHCAPEHTRAHEDGEDEGTVVEEWDGLVAEEDAEESGDSSGPIVRSTSAILRSKVRKTTTQHVDILHSHSKRVISAVNRIDRFCFVVFPFVIVAMGLLIMRKKNFPLDEERFPLSPN